MIEEEIRNALNLYYPTAQAGTGHDTETPYILYTYQETPYKFGRQGNLNLYLIAYTDYDLTIMQRDIEAVFSCDYLGNCRLRKVDYRYPNKQPLADGRIMQQIEVILTYEEG